MGNVFVHFDYAWHMFWDAWNKIRGVLALSPKHLICTCLNRCLSFFPRQRSHSHCLNLLFQGEWGDVHCQFSRLVDASNPCTATIIDWGQTCYGQVAFQTPGLSSRKYCCGLGPYSRALPGQNVADLAFSQDVLDHDKRQKSTSSGDILHWILEFSPVSPNVSFFSRFSVQLSKGKGPKIWSVCPISGWRKIQGSKRNPNFLVRISSSGVGVLGEGVGPNSSIRPSKPPGFFAGISRGRPNSLRKKSLCSISSPKNARERANREVQTVNWKAGKEGGCRDRCQERPEKGA